MKPLTIKIGPATQSRWLRCEGACDERAEEDARQLDGLLRRVPLVVKTTDELDMLRHGLLTSDFEERWPVEARALAEQLEELCAKVGLEVEA